MELNISARNLTVSDRFRDYVSERAHKVEHLAHRIDSLNIKVTRHDHSRTAGQEDQVELTVFEPGHVIRAEAQASDKFAAFDIAFSKLAERMRRAGDRQKNHRGQHRTPSIGEMTAHDFAELDVRPVDADKLLGLEKSASSASASASAPGSAESAGPDFGESPIVIRRKQFESQPMTIDEALYQMEMVGHDFYLFLDSETQKPSVVYRRKGWNYGVITLA